MMPGNNVARCQRENARLYVRCFENRLDAFNGIVALLLYIRSHGHALRIRRIGHILDYAAFIKTSASHSGSSSIMTWPEVVFSITVHEGSALHSAIALLNADAGNLEQRM